jgi:hypothetical protein
MNIEIFQPYLKYLGIGALITLGIILLIWLGFSYLVMSTTQGIPTAINDFFSHLGTNDINQAYQLTTANFQARTSKKQFSKFIKIHNLKTYKRILLGISPTKGEGEYQEIPIKIILQSGQEIPILINLTKQEDNNWQVDRFDLDPNPENA